MNDEIAAWLKRVRAGEVPEVMRVDYDVLRDFRTALEQIDFEYITTEFPKPKYHGRFGSRYNEKGDTQVFRSKYTVDEDNVLEVRVARREAFGHWSGYLSCKKVKKNR